MPNRLNRLQPHESTRVVDRFPHAEWLTVDRNVDWFLLVDGNAKMLPMRIERGTGG
ncbi:putative metallo-dependent phosphatase [Sesbania bispinosa]|nr:putative metallo-dependent phosphatase [Sesbania bispinosa]